MISHCASKSCKELAVQGNMFCHKCSDSMRVSIGQAGIIGQLAPNIATPIGINTTVMKGEHHDRRSTDQKMSFKYPKYYKEIPAGVTELDIYMVCHIFQVNDYSGALHHAIKKILLPGVRTGGKTRRDDIKEARDTLTRWLELHK